MRLIVDEVVVREAQGRGLEVALLAVGVDGATRVPACVPLVVRAVPSAVVNELSGLVAFRSWLVLARGSCVQLSFLVHILLLLR